MATKKRFQPRVNELFGIDVGATGTKTLKVRCNNRGELWPASGYPSADDAASIPTPTGVLSAEGFFDQIDERLDAAGLVPRSAERGYAVCMPVREVTGELGTKICGPSFNLGIRESFRVRGIAVGSDGICHGLGSYFAGAARDLTGSYALTIYGGGIGGATILRQRNQLVLLGRESHFPIYGKKRQTWEQLASKPAFERYMQRAGLTWQNDVGHACDKILKERSQSQDAYRVRRALACWHRFAARGLIAVINVLNLGGASDEPFKLGLSGGLYRFFEPQRIYDHILEFSGGEPWFDPGNFEVIVEPNGHWTACVGAAMMAVARKVGCDVLDIKVLDAPPA